MSSNQHARSFSAGHMQLTLRFGVDFTAAAAASVSVSPIVSLIDRSVVTKTSTGQSMTTCLWQSLKPIIRSPLRFIVSRPLRLLVGVYLGTYLTANSIDTIHSYNRSKPPATVSPTLEKFIGTAVVSTGLTVYKDACFAQMFGSKTSKAVPLSSYLLFTLRDAITIYGCFIMPPLLAQKLTELPPDTAKHFSSLLATESSRLKTAQFLLPAAIQFVSTPIHLLGLDFHNRQHRISWADRAKRVNRDLWTAIPVRMMRIVPAFGIGGVINMSTREALMNRIDPARQDLRRSSI